VAHGKSCALSLRKPSTCECECGGHLHGSAYRASLGDSPDVRRIPPRQRKVRRALAAVAVAVTGTIGGLAVTGNFGGSSDGNSRLTAQVNVDLKGTISALSSLGFGEWGISSSGTSNSSRRTDCAESATGQVRQFFTRYPCEQYVAETWTIKRQGTTALVAFSWVEMATVSLAAQYKAEVDAYGTGNPPGISSAFNGYCYASDQQGAVVWAVEVKPSGNASVDQGVLRDAVKADLSQGYLQKHCTE
jgi:hypothetical protein